jgi:hypothetical protein
MSYVSLVMSICLLVDFIMHVLLRYHETSRSLHERTAAMLSPEDHILGVTESVKFQTKAGERTMEEDVGTDTVVVGVVLYRRFYSTMYKLKRLQLFLHSCSTSIMSL